MIREAFAIAVLAGCGGTPAPRPAAAGPTSPRKMIATLVHVVRRDESTNFLAIEEVSPAGVTELIESSELAQQLAWLDAHTTLALLPEVGSSGSRVDRYRDGSYVDTIEVPLSEWNPERSSRLVVTAANEAWLADCSEPEACEHYLRIVPAPRVGATRAPPAIDPARVAGYDVADAPPRAAVTPTSFRVTVDAGGAVTCASSSGTSRTDKLHARTTRWVQTDPPVYEVTGGEPDPIHYFRACADDAYTTFASLGDGLWALARPAPDIGLTVTVFYGDRAIGTIERAGPLRANR